MKEELEKTLELIKGIEANLEDIKDSQRQLIKNLQKQIIKNLK
jgi:hypothetical protein